jgi:hypothetical protein
MTLSYANLAFSSGGNALKVTDRWGAGEELFISRSSIALIFLNASSSTTRTAHPPVAGQPNAPHSRAGMHVPTCRRAARMSDPSGSLRRMTSPAHGDQHTSGSDPFIAQRCACGHPVSSSDDHPGGPCTLCACSDHRLRRKARAGTPGPEVPGVNPPPSAVP